MKIAFGMIVFEGDYVLRECLKQVYPFASQILISEGPVKYWQDKGKETSEDETNLILDNFPDPEKKIKIIHGKFSEKDDQCNSYVKFLNDDIDYLWNLDSDEVYKTDDILKTIEFLKREMPSSIGIRSCTFYGGFDRTLSGFELKKDNFKRIFRVVKGSKWLTHRPPTIEYPMGSQINIKHVDSDTFYNSTGVQMYHYSYVFPRQVYQKVGYYKSEISKENCIDDYFNLVYIKWVLGNAEDKKNVESTYSGVHEFKPHVRGECYTEPFLGFHPEAIEQNLETLKIKLQQQIEYYGKL